MIVPALPGEATLVASWRALARRSHRAAVTESPRSVAAVFPAWAPLNNAIARMPADDAEPARLSAVYRAAGVDSWSYWIPSASSDLTAPDEVTTPGMVRDVSTLVMRTELDRELRVHEDAIPTSVTSAAEAGDEPVALGAIGEPGVGESLVGWAMVRDGSAIAGLWSCVHEGDCGIYAVGTAPGFRRRGVARSLVEHALAVARDQGARTASLQSTPMAVSLYQGLGFEAVGRYEEWVVDAASSSWSNQTRSSNGMPSTSSPSG
jgi:ribosomal protein S18 acetylase RimI-like enzyme